MGTYFDWQHSLTLANWARKDIAHEASVPLEPRSATEFTLEHNVASKAYVVAVIEQRNNRGRNRRSAARCILGRLHRFLPLFPRASASSPRDTERFRTGSPGSAIEGWRLGHSISIEI